MIAARLGVRSAAADATLAALGGTVAATAAGVAWTPPDRDAARIHVHHARRPLRGADHALVDAVAELRDHGGDAALVASQRLVTHEGEHAILGRITGHLDGARFELHVAVVIGGESYAELHVLARQPGLFAGFRDLAVELVLGYELGLGALRRRRCVYQPPPGWTATDAHRATVWRAPDHDRRHGVITIADAAPLRSDGADGAAAAAIAACGFAVDATPRLRAAITTRAGLRGDYVEVAARDRRRIFEVVTLRDDRYAYQVTMEADVDDLAARRRALEALVESLEPVPAPRRRRVEPTTLAHWAE